MALFLFNRNIKIPSQSLPSKAIVFAILVRGRQFPQKLSVYTNIKQNRALGNNKN
jgi:hypothetical protein